MFVNAKNLPVNFLKCVLSGKWQQCYEMLHFHCICCNKGIGELVRRFKAIFYTTVHTKTVDG